MYKKDELPQATNYSAKGHTFWFIIYKTPPYSFWPTKRISIHREEIESHTSYIHCPNNTLVDIKLTSKGIIYLHQKN